MSKAKLAEIQGAKAKPPGPKPSPKGGGKGVASLSIVKETFAPPFQENKICALDEPNLKHLRDGLGLCSPCITIPGKRQSESFRTVVRNALSTRDMERVDPQGAARQLR